MLSRWFLIVMAVGWVAYERTGDGLLLVLSAGSAYALLVLGYMKWVIATEQERLKWLDARSDPESAVARNSAPGKISEPPERTGKDWALWIGRSLLQVYRFEEIDLFFWVGLFLILDELTLLVWLLGVSQVIGMLVMVVKRTLDARNVDVRRRRAG